MARSTQYQYQELRADEFRLLNLAPALLRSSPLQASMFTTNLNSPVQYEVLCYTWGQPEETHTINCDGSLLSIRDNLADALYSLRDHYLPRCLRIDSICINQENNQERNTQVTLMNRISRQASQGIFWVGIESPLTSAAFELLSTMVLARQEVFQDSRSNVPGQVLDGHILIEYRRRLPSPERREWKGLDEILNRNIFTRAWTLPDLVLISNAILCCGSLVFPWVDFCYALEGYASYSYPNFLRSPGIQTIVNARNIQLRFLETIPIPLGLDIILDAMRSLKATDERDKIFAAYSIIRTLAPDTIHELSVDYGKISEEIFADAAKALNKNARLAPSFCSLSMAEDSGSNQLEQKQIPSWVPKWMNQGPTYRLNSSENFFFASKTRGVEDFEISTTGDLSFMGFLIDRVDEVADYLPPRRLHDKYNVNGGNSFFLLKWFDLVDARQGKYKKDNERLLLDWIETIQSKGCNLWQALEPHNPSTLLDQARTWLKYLSNEDEEETEDVRQFHAACLPSHGRRFGISARGNFCLFPKSTSRNDAICIPLGSKVPFIFRKDGDHYQNIGECYVHGAMDGDALGWEGAKEEKFVIC